MVVQPCEYTTLELYTWEKYEFYVMWTICQVFKMRKQKQITWGSGKGKLWVLQSIPKDIYLSLLRNLPGGIKAREEWQTKYLHPLWLEMRLRISTLNFLFNTSGGWGHTVRPRTLSKEEVKLFADIRIKIKYQIQLKTSQKWDILKICTLKLRSIIERTKKKKRSIDWLEDYC